MSEFAVRDDLRRYGPGWMLFRLGYRVLHRALRFRMIDCFTLEAKDLDREYLGGETPYDCRFLTREELLDFSRDPANRLSARVIERALAKGDECFGILDGEKLASLGWYARGPTTILRDVRVHFDLDWVYMYAGFTRSEYRGQRLHALGMGRACEAYTGRGYRGLVSNVERDNVASERSCFRLGYRRVGTVYRLGLGRSALFLPTRGARRGGFRTEKAPRRRPERPPAGELPDLATVHAEERRIMDGYAPHYDELPLTNSYVFEEERRLFVDWMLETLRGAGRTPGALSYLDVGCGPGYALDLLARAGCTRLTGLDLTASMLDAARRGGPAGARWVQASIERHPFAHASFDVVVAAFTIHHLRDLEAFFEMVDEVLVPGGWFFVLEFDGDGLLMRRRTRRRAQRILAPLRWLIRHKPPNASVLGRIPAVPEEFNPAHFTPGFDEVRGALPQRDRYRLRCDSHGILTWTVRDVVVKESALDRWLLRVLRRVDRSARQLGAGTFQWICGERRVEESGSFQAGSSRSGG